MQVTWPAGAVASIGPKSGQATRASRRWCFEAFAAEHFFDRLSPRLFDALEPVLELRYRERDEVFRLARRGPSPEACITTTVFPNRNSVHPAMDADSIVRYLSVAPPRSERPRASVRPELGLREDHFFGIGR